MVEVLKRKLERNLLIENDSNLAPTNLWNLFGHDDAESVLRFSRAVEGIQTVRNVKLLPYDS